MTDARSRVWPVFVEIRDTIQSVLAPALPLPTLLRRGRGLARCLRETPRRRKMQRAKLNGFFRIY
jgi:hypothetical protein